MVIHRLMGSYLFCHPRTMLAQKFYAVNGWLGGESALLMALT
jgi:hypothetical protein